eukprot:TRINITY_DN3776_c0_g1_i1.p1 TRINITY_DN3776_c0_g1~~TRINITY_DN3776_c0_g1_i1.p1  ORF type:complete len:210 (-),score=16.72 TRINITY_DN3776_c0_g1_i1:17-646(-)
MCIRDRGVCLGLSIAQALSIALGSQGINVESEEGQGSTFSFSIPLQVEILQSSPSLEKRVEDCCSNDINCNCKEILVVDDNDYNVFVIKTKLKKLGFQVHSAANGKIAIDFLTNCFLESRNVCQGTNCQSIRLIFMDVDMPILNGIDTTKILISMMKSKQMITIPIIGCSAFDSPEDINMALAAGMQDYISKPVTEEKLNRILKAYNVS